METRYVAEFKISEITGKEEKDRKKDSNEILDKERKITSKQVGRVLTTGVAVTMVGSQIYSKMQSTSNSITGDAVAQRRLDNKMAYVNEGLGLFGTLGIGTIIGGPAGLLTAVGGLSVKYSMQLFNQSQHNIIKQAQWQVETKVNQEKQNRLVKDSTGIRI